MLTHADELQRIDSIVTDITNLKTRYEQEKVQLQECQIKLLDEKQKNMILKRELDSYALVTQKEQEYEKSIANLKEQIKKLKAHLNLKENINVGKAPKRIKKTKKPVKELKKEYTKPATYRIIQDADIYDGRDGAKLEIWEKGRSFTSHYRTDKWIKVSGYFVNRKWQAAGSEMWVKSAVVVKR